MITINKASAWFMTFRGRFTGSILRKQLIDRTISQRGSNLGVTGHLGNFHHDLLFPVIQMAMVPWKQALVTNFSRMHLGWINHQSQGVQLDAMTTGLPLCSYPAVQPRTYPNRWFIPLVCRVGWIMADEHWSYPQRWAFGSCKTANFGSQPCHDMPSLPWHGIHSTPSEAQGTQWSQTLCLHCNLGNGGDATRCTYWW